MTFPSRRFQSPATALFAILVVSCAPSPSGDGDPSVEELGEDLSALLEHTLQTSAEIPGAMLRVVTDSLLPARPFTWQGAVGVSDRETGEPLRPEQTLRIASNTKTYVAATTLRLVEEDRMELDDPVSRRLRPASIAILRDGGYDVDRITIRMLLRHTSGIWNYASSEVFLQRVATDPRHRWTRREQLELVASEGAPLGEPGETYHYSDTGYILLGEILEEVTGQPLYEVLQEVLRFDELGLEHTWMEGVESPPSSAPVRAHQYVDGLDGNDIHPSADLFGGGGLVSTLADMSRFYRALLHGQIFERPETLEAMLTVSPESVASTTGGYGMGIGREEMAGVTCYGHGGYWGTVVRHCPLYDLTVVAAVTTTAGTEELRALLDGAVELGMEAVEP